MFLLLGIDDLMSEFNVERSPSLANKPKLFLVQACRGPAEDKFLRPTDKSQDIADFTLSDSTLSRSSCPPGKAISCWRLVQCRGTSPTEGPILGHFLCR